MRIGLARVRGRSMLPGLRPGDRVLVRYAGSPPRVGEIVVARFADATVVLKRVGRIDVEHAGPSFWLLSDNPAEGVDSRHRGAVAESELLGVVICRVWPPRLFNR